MAKKPKREYVRWVDSRSADGWVQPDNIDKHAGIAESVGWLVFENKHTVGLAASIFKRTGQVAGVIMIPKRSILKRRKI